MPRLLTFSLLSIVLTLVGCVPGEINSSSVPPQAFTIQTVGGSTVVYGGSLQLKAYLWNGVDTSASWSVDPATPFGTVTSQGLYMAPETVGSQKQVTLRAFDPTINLSASTTITVVVAPVMVLNSAAPSTVTPGSTAQINLSGVGLSNLNSVLVNSQSVPVSSTSDTQVSFAYSVQPWSVGGLTIQGLSSNPTISPTNVVSIALTQPVISYDAAARFLQQASWGPTPAAIQQVQSLGFSGYIDQQLASGPDYFNTDGDDGHVVGNLLIYGVSHDASQLRTKMAWIWWKLFCTPGSSVAWATSAVPDQINRDAFVNFETLFTDVTLNPQMGDFLSYSILDYPGATPNLNFGRESMQLFSTGAVLLNPDGTAQLDGNGQEVPAYSEADVLAVSRAVTGFVYPDNYRQLGDSHGEQQLQSSDSFPHDEDPKTILGVTLPANQTATQDTEAAIHILASQPNVGPFIGSYLIHELVTSNPSPAYVARVTAAWNDNGHGVRGDIPTVLKAILLDPEARAGDDPTQISDTEGRFLDAPETVVYTFRALNSLQVQSGAAAAAYCISANESIWTAPNIFGFYQQTTVLPNTSLRAPESQLFTTTAIQVHADWLYGIIYLPPGTGVLDSNFDWTYWDGLASGDGSQLIDFLNHLVLHGSMSDSLKSVLQQDVQQQSDPTLRAQKMLFDTFLSPETAVQR